MGAGLALEFRLRYPDMFEDYKLRCKRGEVKPGEPYIFRETRPWILNFPTKDHWKYPSRLEWIKKGLEIFVEKYKWWGVQSIAFPLLGTRNGKLRKEEVLRIMQDKLSQLEIPVYICFDEKPKEGGVEWRMLELLRKISPRALHKEAHVPLSLAKRIKQEDISRFRHLRRLEGIGPRTYEKIFMFFYTKALGAESRQPSLFP